ncbi:MAG: TRAP transporter permease [Deltaproteobacteria bacterium]|jgi:TRAP transporter 4TM/12TM fusion protein|nr:TRAP transporter permease [Deltaproteobacteria bacterium]
MLSESGAGSPHHHRHGAVIAQMLERETGRRKPEGIPHAVIILTAVSWSLFQLWICSPLPYSLGFGVFNDTATRALHLTFAVFLAYLGFPFLRSSPSERIPLYDWALALAAAFCACYLFIFQEGLSRRPGIPLPRDVAVAVAGALLLLEATRRVMGLPMTLVAVAFLAYAFLGPYFPEVISHRGASLSRAASQFWLTQEGVFGVPLGVSASFVFLYVLFGSMLENAGAGAYLTALSFSLLGRLRGGPAKAAVVASGLHGLISGSSIANVLTCGPVTILLMKKAGFSAEKAGAVEVAAGSNGQIMPPVMGAAAFLMAEYTGIPYSQIIRHAFVPAILAYFSLLYIVHIESVKLGMEPAGRPAGKLAARLLRGLLLCSGGAVAVCLAYYALAWIPTVFGKHSYLAFGALLTAGYVALLLVSLRFPQIPEGDTDALMRIGAVTPVLFAGLYYLLPTAVLVWGLMVMEMSPGLAAYYACLMMILILLTQKPLAALARREPVRPRISEAVSRLLSSLINGAKNMVGIGLATATAGIIVGAVSLTGVGQVLASLVEAVSGGNLPVVLVLTALLAIILGMGLPTTANYIIVSTLLAPVIYYISAAHGLGVPLLAVHLFCLYFGVMADATPPVALAAFAASGISGGNPFRTGIQGFIYELRTAVLPFVFLYNQEILLLNIRNAWHFAWVLATSALACIAFASLTQRFMVVKARLWELAVLAAATLFLFRPDIPQDFLFKPYLELPPSMVMETVEALPPEVPIRLRVETDFGGGKVVRQTVVLPFEGEGAERRLESAGAYLAWDGDRLLLDDVGYGSRLERLGVNMEDPTAVLGVETAARRPDKWLFSIPGVALLALVYLVQRRRKTFSAKAARPRAPAGQGAEASGSVSGPSGAAAAEAAGGETGPA